MQLAIKTGNRDALLFFLKGNYSTVSDSESHNSSDNDDNDNELKTLSVKDGFQAMMILFVCKPHNCCQYYRRFEVIKEFLYQNKLDISIGPEFISSIVQCPHMKKLLEDWIKTPPEPVYDWSCQESVLVPCLEIKLEKLNLRFFELQ